MCASFTAFEEEEAFSADGAAGGSGGGGGEDDDIASGRVGGGQEHAVTHFAAQGAGLEVGDHDDLFADELLGLIEGANASADLSFFTTEIDLKDEQFVGVRMSFCFKNRGNAELNLGEVVNGDGGIDEGLRRWRGWSGLSGNVGHDWMPFE